MKLLFVEDDPNVVDRIVAELESFGFELEHARVDEADLLDAAIANGTWSAVIAEASGRSIDARRVLQIVRERNDDIPVIVVSGTGGEEAAVDIIRAGANDFVLESRLGRLGPALERELRDVQLRQERRVLFQALRRAEDRFRRVFEKVPAGVAVSTPSGQLIAVNERFAAIFARAVSEIIGTQVSELGWDPAHLSEITFEQQYTRTDGHVVWMRVTGAPVFDESGAVEQLTWLVEDITGQRRYEAQLASQKVQLEQAQQLARIGSFEHDLASGRTVWSEELYRIWGLEIAEAPDAALVDARIHPGDLERILSLRRAIREMAQPYTTDHRIVLPNGDVRILHVRGRFVLDEHRRPVKLVGVMQDVTESRAQEAELERRAAQQALVANLGQAALGAEPVESLMDWAADNVTRMLGVDFGIVMRADGDSFRIISDNGWKHSIRLPDRLPAERTPQAALTVRTQSPVIVEDCRAETRFAKSFLLDHGVVSSVIVPISSGAVTAWGTLGAFSKMPRAFPTSDVDFLRSVATVLGQAVERDRVDRQLVFHAAQQSAMAELSRIALTSVEDAIARACTLLREIFEVEYAVYFEVDEASETLHGTAGSPRVPRMTLPIHGSPVGEALEQGAPVVIESYDPGGPWSTPFVRLGLDGGIAVPVASHTRRFGVLTAHSSDGRRLMASHVELLESLANILSDGLERELGRRALAESEQRYRDVVEGASEVIFIASPDGVFTSINAAFSAMTGWKVEDWRGRSIRELLAPEEVVRFVALLRSVIGEGRPHSEEFTINSPNGVLLWDVTALPKIEDGRPVAVYGFARDVTEKRLVEYDRQQLTRNLQLLLQSTVEGIVTVDRDGNCTMSNRAAAEILGLSPDQILGANLRILLGPVDIQPILDVAGSGEIYVSTDTFWNSSGLPVPVEFSAAPVIDRGEPVGVVISFSDISSRRKLEAKLEQADRLTSLGRLAATIAHEFNNILMGISPFIEIMRRGRNIEAALDHVARAVKRGKRITEDILRFTQPAEPVRAAIDTSSWLDHIMMEARSVLPREIDLDWSVDPPDLLIHGDANQLQQIFTNLILNARDAMVVGSGLLSVSARRGSADARAPFGVIEQPERFAHFIVRDNGVGMPPDILRHIFEPLFTTKKAGTGLGLAVAHQVVKRHDGEIFVESIPGEGTTFNIFLPLAAENELLAGEPVIAKPDVLQPRNILIVEDDESVASGLVALLELEGMRVTVASTGHAAIRAIATIQVDIVLLDIGLPDMEGIAVYAEIAARRPDLPIIFSTGHGDRSKLQELLDRPHIAYLLKPYDSIELLDAIRSVV